MTHHRHLAHDLFSPFAWVFVFVGEGLAWWFHGGDNGSCYGCSIED